MVLNWIPRLAFARSNAAPRGDILIVVFLRGAADALNMLVPHGEEAYYRLRPTLAVRRPDDTRAPAAERSTDLDGFFGLHPALGALLPAWQARHLAIVQACGAPDESRSHFRAMELMERGVDDERGPGTGWIGRHLALTQSVMPSPLRAVAIGEMAPRSLMGSIPVNALRSIAEAHLGAGETKTRRLQTALAGLYRGSTTGEETLRVMRALERIDPSAPAANGARYSSTEFGHGLRQAALLVKADIGLEVAALDLGGWDTHFAQTAQLDRLLRDLAEGLAALHRDLFDQMGRVTVVCVSEFGRRAAENGSLGTDHGHGGLMLLLGGHVRGGRLHGAWPGLGEGQLVGPGDLAVTTDYRDVLGELCATRLRNPALDVIFPGYTVKPRGVFEPG